MGMFSGHSVALSSLAMRQQVAAGAFTTSKTPRGAARGLVRAARLSALLLSAITLWSSDARANQFVQMDYNIFLQTRARGSVFIELYDDRPLTTANFLQYVNGGLYNNSLMHRLSIVNPYVLQGGGYYPQYIDEPATELKKSLNPSVTVDLDGNPATPNPTVNNEYNNSPPRLNVAGAAARSSQTRPRGSSRRGGCLPKKSGCPSNPYPCGAHLLCFEHRLMPHPVYHSRRSGSL